jgi:flagellar motor switch protein FliM
MDSNYKPREPAASVRRADLTGRERHLRGAMQAMSRIANRFARAGRQTLPFMVRRRARLLPQGVSIVDGLATAQDLGRAVRLEIALEATDGSGWAELVINAEGLALILEGSLGAADGASMKALGDEITPAARALATRMARSLANDFLTAVRDEVGLGLNIVAVRAVSPGEPTEGQTSDGLRVDCLFEGLAGACVALVMSAEALESAANERDEVPQQQGDPHVAESVCEVPIELVAVLGTASLGLRRLLALRVGDVLRLPTAVDDAISVRVGGVRKFRAVPVTSRGQIAIEIRGRHED